MDLYLCIYLLKKSLFIGLRIAVFKCDLNQTTLQYSVLFFKKVFSDQSKNNFVENSWYQVYHIGGKNNLKSTIKITYRTVFYCLYCIPNQLEWDSFLQIGNLKVVVDPQYRKMYGGFCNKSTLLFPLIDGITISVTVRIIINFTK